MASSTGYFSGLNYTLANEDTSLETELLSPSTDTVLTIAGSGGRVLPLLSKTPRRVICVDLSAAQLHLARLRLGLAREAPLEDFLGFFGYPLFGGHEAIRRDGHALRRHWVERLDLPNEARAFLKGWLASLDWGTPIYDGRWERTFLKLSRMTRAVLGSAGRQIMECRTLDEQRDYLATRFPRARWNLVLALLGNASVFNALLYRGSFPRKNIPGSMLSFYRSRFDRLFASAPARENFFLQLVFLGGLVHPEGNPVECHPETYRAAAEALQTAEILFECGDAVEIASRQRGTIGFLSFSDVPSYFSGPRERSFLQQIRPGLAPGATVVLRHYLRVPEGSDRSGFRDSTAQHAAQIAREKVGVYDIEVLHGMD